MTDTTDIWKKYEQGVDHHNKISLYSDTERAHNFFEGKQWEGLESGGESLPFYNFIQPTCEYKIASVAMNNMTIHYAPMSSAGQEVALAACNTLNEHAAKVWENQKMDRKMWESVKEACISGDTYIYFYNSSLDCQLIDNTNIYFADEQQTDMQKQPYIIIYERRNIEDVKKDAEANEIPQDEIDLIMGDDDTTNLIGSAKDEVQGVSKCSCLLYLELKDGTLHFTRATKNVIYQPETAVDGLSVYPVASLVWMRKKNSSRGNGEVTQLIPNQIAANRLLVRREMSAKMTAFAKPVYSKTGIANYEDVDKVGVALEVTGSVQKAADAFAYVAPSPMSSDAHNLQSELIIQTRELAGAGDAALGLVNPEQASGTAIIAVRDQAAIPLNEQIALFKQFVEDIALIWFEVWAAYSPNGLEVETAEEVLLIPQEILREMKVGIRVDVSPTSPYSKYAQEQSIENALARGYITFEEYVEVLDDGATAPKAKLGEILQKREIAKQQQMAYQMQQAGLQQSGLQQTGLQQSGLQQTQQSILNLGGMATNGVQMPG